MNSHVAALQLASPIHCAHDSEYRLHLPDTWRFLWSVDTEMQRLRRTSTEKWQTSQKQAATVDQWSRSSEVIGKVHD